MVSTVKSDGTRKSIDEILPDVMENEVYKAGITPKKSDLLGMGNSGYLSPLNPLLSKSWLHFYLYSRVSWIYGSAHLIGNSAASAGISIIPKAGEDVDERTEKFIKALGNFFEEANEEQNFTDIYKQIHIDLAIEGAGYIAFKFPETQPPFSFPIAMYRIDYRTIKPIRMDEFLSHFNINKTELPAEYHGLRNPIITYCQQVIECFESSLEPLGRNESEVPTLKNAPWLFGSADNVRYFHPLEILEIKLDAQKTSPLDALEYSLATEIAAQMYTLSYFKNSTKTGMVFSLEGGTREDVARNKEKLREEYSNPDKAWQSMFLFGNIKLVRDSANTSDVQYLEIRKFNREECCATMGTYPSLLGQSSAKGTDKEEDKSSFEEETVRPRSKIILQAVTRYLYKIFKEFKFKFEIVSGVKGRSSLHLMKVAQMQLMAGGSPNESRKLIGLPENKTEKYSDMPFTAANLVPMNLLDDLLGTKIGPDAVKDNNPGGQPRTENVQDGRSGRTNEQRGVV